MMFHGGGDDMFALSAMPRRTMLSDSVPQPVKMISFSASAAFSARATFSLASATALCASCPNV